MVLTECGQVSNLRMTATLGETTYDTDSQAFTPDNHKSTFSSSFVRFKALHSCAQLSCWTRVGCTLIVEKLDILQVVSPQA
jgi:hypothetical protein